MTTAMRSAQGGDYSSWQPLMNLTGCDFVFCRATIGDGSLTTPPSQTAGAVSKGVDAKFAQFWQQAGKTGIPRGAYHFFYPGQSAAAQAKLFVATVKANGLKPGDILVCDSETLTADVDGQTLAFCEAVTNLVPPSNPVLVYTNHDTGQHLVKTAAHYPGVWFAWPSATAPPAGFIFPFQRWLFWQWGETGGIDADAFNGTAADLAAWIGTYTKGTHVKDLGGAGASGIASARWDSGTDLVVAVRADGTLWKTRWSGGRWHSWRPVTDGSGAPIGGLAGVPAVVAWGSGAGHLRVIRASDRHVLQYSTTDGGATWA